MKLDCSLVGRSKRHKVIGEVYEQDLRRLPLTARLRRFVEEVQSWCTKKLSAEDDEHSIESCRRLVRFMGQAGWYEAVLAGDPISAVDDVRKACLLRCMLAASNGQADFAFGQQLEALAVVHFFGSDEHQRVWLPRLITGELVASLAWSEFEELGTGCRAVREGAHWLLDGEIPRVGFGELADVLVVFARMIDSDGDRISAFVVPGEAPGLGVVERLDTEATRLICRVRLDGVRVPNPAIIMSPDRGSQIFAQACRRFAVSTGAASIGLARQGLRTVASMISVAGGDLDAQIKDTRWALDALELLIYRTAERQDFGESAGDVEAEQVLRYVLKETQQKIEQIIACDFGKMGESPSVAGFLEQIAQQIRVLSCAGFMNTGRR